MRSRPRYPAARNCIAVQKSQRSAEATRVLENAFRVPLSFKMTASHWNSCERSGAMQESAYAIEWVFLSHRQRSADKANANRRYQKPTREELRATPSSGSLRPVCIALASLRSAHGDRLQTP